MIVAENAPKSYGKFADLVTLSVAEAVLESGGIDEYIGNLHISSPDDVDGLMFPVLKAYLVERMAQQSNSCGVEQQSGTD